MTTSQTKGTEYPLHILIAEDNSDTAKSFALLLQMEGYVVHIASDGLAAVEAAELHHPDAVLLDIGLPKLNGYEVAKRLREKKGPKRPLLIAITSYGQRVDRLHAYEAGIDMHVTKPVDPQELVDLLKRYREINEPR
jgi:CheY-like chemotaxis protein